MTREVTDSDPDSTAAQPTRIRRSYAGYERTEQDHCWVYRGYEGPPTTWPPSLGHVLDLCEELAITLEDVQAILSRALAKCNSHSN